MKKIRVLIVEDSKVIREFLEHIIGNDPRLEIVGAVGIFKKHPLERYYRDVRAGTNHPFSNARMRELIGKNALGIRLLEMPRWLLIGLYTG